MSEQHPIPVRPLPLGAAVGPGTQPTESDGAELGYLAMPGEMQTYHPPVLPEPEEIESLTEGLELLRLLHDALLAYHVGNAPRVIDLRVLDPANLRLVEDSLGEGEVSILRTATGRERAQETRLAGVWRVQTSDADGRVTHDALEIADVPGFLRETAFAAAAAGVAVPERLPEGVMNAPGVLAELNDQVARRRGGASDAPHIVNLTLLPQSEQDLTFLGERLGIGDIRILSRGYGNCRITTTTLDGVWWVQFYNSDDSLILNTLEVTDVPAAALAAQEDIDDSAARLGEILEALR
ncbi:MAG: hydrogenase expression/formation C-terminal domain-containing protein [Thiohalocapsa sp.]